MCSFKIFTQKFSGAGLRCVFVMTLRTLLSKQWISRWFETSRGSCDGTVFWSFVHSIFNSHQLPCQFLKILIVNQIQLNGFNFRHSKEQWMLINPNSKTFRPEISIGSVVLNFNTGYACSNIWCYILGVRLRITYIKHVYSNERMKSSSTTQLSRHRNFFGYHHASTTYNAVPLPSPHY